MRTLGRRSSVWMSEAAIVEVEAAATARKGAIIRVTMVATAEFNAMSCATRGASAKGCCHWSWSCYRYKGSGYGHL